MLVDIEKDTVDFQLNFDDTLKEPLVLPTAIPDEPFTSRLGIRVGNTRGSLSVSSKFN
jgi:DNA gyrase subunit A